MSKQFDALLDFWVKNNMNVILEGEHGFGKTAVAGDTFVRNGLRWKYFSASTMDPWVDLVGVPKEYTDEDGVTYLKLIRPKEFQNDEYDAIFFDEFNRAPKKVRNAVMELIQFKSINGHKFHNLKVVWAAINPHDDEETYDVEKLDPAQIDRFHVRYEVPSVPDKDFFYKKYGATTGKAAIEWWSAIPDKARKLVSARRLEYVLDCFQAGGDIKYLVDKSTNPSKLLMVLNSGSVIDTLRTILQAQDDAELMKFLKKENNFDVAVDLMRNDIRTIPAIVPYIDEERLMRITHDIPAVRDFVTKFENLDQYADMLNAVLKSGTLDTKEETKLRALLARGVRTDKHGVIMFVPQPSAAVCSPEDTYDQISDMVTSLVGADSNAMFRAYQFMALNLCEPSKNGADNVTAVLDALCVLFRFIDSEKDSTLVTAYTKLIPMINFLMGYMKASGVDFNDPNLALKLVFKNGKRKLRSVVKVQGFIDSHHSSFATKPRLM